MAWNRVLPFQDEDHEPIAVPDELWSIVSIFRSHMGLAVTSHMSEPTEWYFNAEEGLHRRSVAFEAFSASDLHRSLKVSLYDTKRVMM